ncbi:L-lactate dehydrogenase, partial [Clostridioides difficile]
GIQEIIELNLDATEREKFNNSCEILSGNINRLTLV